MPHLLSDATTVFFERVMKGRQAAIEFLFEGEGHSPVCQELLPHTFYRWLLVRATDLFESRNLCFERDGVTNGYSFRRAPYFTE